MNDKTSESYRKLRALYQKKFIREGWQPTQQQIRNPIKYKNVTNTSNVQQMISTHSSLSPKNHDRYNNLIFRKQEETQKKKEERNNSNNKDIYIQYMATDPVSNYSWIQNTSKNSRKHRIAHSSQSKHRNKTQKAMYAVTYSSHAKEDNQHNNFYEHFSGKKHSLIKILDQMKMRGRNKQVKTEAQSPHKQLIIDSKNSIIHRNKQKLRALADYRDQKYRQYLRKNNVYSESSKTTRVVHPEYFLERQVEINPWIVNQSEY